jgi:hypothetical protein
MLWRRAGLVVQGELFSGLCRWSSPGGSFTKAKPLRDDISTVSRIVDEGATFHRMFEYAMMAYLRLSNPGPDDP